MAESAHADVHLMAVEESAPVAMLSPLTEEGPFQLRCMTLFSSQMKALQQQGGILQSTDIDLSLLKQRELYDCFP